jgi:hypothetical protein
VSKAAREGEQDRLCAIRTRESDTATGEPVEIGRGLILTPVTGQVIDAEIVGEDQDDIRLVRRAGEAGGEDQGYREGEKAHGDEMPPSDGRRKDKCPVSIWAGRGDGIPLRSRRQRLRSTEKTTEIEPCRRHPVTICRKKEPCRRHR